MHLPSSVPVLPVADLARSLAFYERLGFEVAGEHPGYVLLAYGPAEVHLIEVPEVEGTETWTGAYLRVADVDAAHAHWSAVGIAILDPPADRPHGVRELAFEDPDGNLWRVGTLLTPSWDPADAADTADTATTSGPARTAEVDDRPELAGSVDDRPEVDPAATAAPTDAVARDDGGAGTGLDAWVPLVAGDERCAGCGLLPGELPARALGAQVRDEVHAFGRLLEAAPDDAVRHRPAPATWSALEYGVHVRDLLTVFAERIVRTLAEHDPELGWWDHEAAIDDGMANESDVGAVVDDLGRNASKVSEALRLVSEDDWDRSATRRPGERFSIELMARFTLHEVVHHRADAEAALAAAGWTRPADPPA